MKKLSILALALLLLAGCTQTSSTYNSKPSNANDTVATVGNATITRQDIYECLMDTAGVDYVLNDLLTHIASTFEVDQEALDAEVASTETTWKAILGESIDTYIESSFGYKTFEEYKQEVLIPSVKQMMMIDQYSVDNFETLVGQYIFVKMGAVIVDDQTTALQVISELSEGSITLEDAVEKYSTDSTNKTNKGALGVVSDLSSCTADEMIVSILPQLTIEAVYSVPVELSTGKFAVLEIQEVDETAMKDEIISALQAAEEIVTEAEAYYLNQNGFTVVDEYLKEQIKTAYPEYIK